MKPHPGSSLNHPFFPLGVLGVLAVVLASSTAAAPKGKPAPGKGRSIPGSGFTLQERGGGLDVDEREYLGTPKTEAAARKALKYLADTQNADGSWGDSRYSADVGI